jgi:hypothetical protein
MKNLIVLGLVYYGVVFNTANAKDSSSYELLSKSKKCEKSPYEGVYDCKYNLKNKVKISVMTGKKGGSTIMKSNYQGGSYYVSTANQHKCLIIYGKNLFDMSFISTLTGKVYKDWDNKDCLY